MTYRRNFSVLSFSNAYTQLDLNETRKKVEKKSDFLLTEK